MTVPGGEVRLRRSAGARLGSGWALQPVLTFAVFFEVVVAGCAAYFAGSAVVVAALPTLPLIALWIVGLTAGARVDSHGLSWRYFVPRRMTWREVSAIELGRQGHSKFGGNGGPAIWVTSAARARKITPALDVGDRRLKDFVEAATAAARSAGVPVRVDPDDRYWRELLAGDLTR